MRPLGYIPNTVEPGHRGDDAVAGYGTLDHGVELARTAEAHDVRGLRRAFAGRRSGLVVHPVDA
jgi:hypothetical protein